MYWKNERHQERFKELQSKVGVTGDREYDSAIYLLAAIGKQLGDYVDRSAIKFDTLKKAARPWSSGEKALVNLAANLFTAGYFKADVFMVFQYLDEDLTRAAIQALQIRFG